MTGYTRTDVSNNIADGNVINASDLDNEFDAIDAAFNFSTGHTHDGTSNGAPITKVGPTQDVVISASAVTPKTTNTVDLGSSLLQYKDLYLDGTANIDSLVADTADINAGTIDGTAIGGSTAAAGSFTTLTASSTATLNTLASSGATLTGGTINDMAIGGTTASSGAFTTLSASSTVSGAGFSTYLASPPAIGGTTAAAGTFTTLTANTSLTAATADINGGTIDGSTIGGTTPAAGAFTTLSASGAVTLSGGTANGVPYLNGSKVLTSGSALTFDGTNLGVGTSSPTNKLSVSGNANITGNTTLGDASTDTVTVNGYMGLGGAGSAGNGLSISSSALTGNNQKGIYVTATASSSATGSFNAIAAAPATAAAAFTVPILAGLVSLDATKGSGSTITNQHGVYIADQTQGTNNYGITSAVSSGTNKWNIYASGTAANYFAGNVGIGTSSPSVPLMLLKGAAGTDLAYLLNAGGYGFRFQAQTGGSGTNNLLYVASGETLSFGVNNAEQMRLTSTGLGIGTSSPATKLHIADGNGLFSGAFKGVLLGEGNCGILGTSATINSASMAFYTANTERARIDASGNVLVGGISSLPIQGATGTGIYGSAGRINIANNSSSATAMAFYSSTQNTGTITTTASATAYNTSSDYRLKENVTTLTGAADRVKALKPVNFAWKADGSRVDGFLAHEAQAVVPEAVTGEKDAVDADGNPVYQGIDQSKLVPLLTAALQEALARIEALEAAAGL